jgi:hypothetical protein
MHPEMTAPIADVREFTKLKADRRNKGRTIEVTRDVFEHFTKGAKHQRITKQELGKLNRLLSAKIPFGKRPALTRTCNCPKCNHEFSFADYVSSALTHAAHTREQLRGFFTGPRCWLTVDTDAKRQLHCPECEHEFAGVFCCYVTDDYAYV